MASAFASRLHFDLCMADTLPVAADGVSHQGFAGLEKANERLLMVRFADKVDLGEGSIWGPVHPGGADCL